MTPRRYLDWFITTPTMLLSTILFFTYNTHQLVNEDNKKITFTEIIENNKEKLIKIFLFNAGMLVFGLLGELEIIPLIMSNILQFHLLKNKKENIIQFLFIKDIYSFVGLNNTS